MSRATNFDGYATLKHSKDCVVLLKEQRKKQPDKVMKNFGNVYLWYKLRYGRKWSYKISRVKVQPKTTSIEDLRVTLGTLNIRLAFGCLLRETHSDSVSWSPLDISTCLTQENSRKFYVSMSQKKLYTLIPWALLSAFEDTCLGK